MREDPCYDCGRRSLVWSTDNNIWNTVIRSDLSPWGDRDPILCPDCFAARCDERDAHVPRWRVLPAPCAPPRRQRPRPDESDYLAHQLGRIRDGQARCVHYSTLRSLADRGFVEGRSLTPLGERVLAWAGSKVSGGVA